MSTGEAKDNKEISKNFTTVLTSQESLINELKLLVESILHSSKLVNNMSSDLQNLFDKINDFDELINIGIELCQHNLTFKFLLYSLQKRIYDAEETHWMNVISDIIVKIDLLEYILFREIRTYNNVNLFKQNFKDLCIMFLCNSDVDLASICWLKYSCMSLAISSNDILDILNSIPYNTKLGAIIIWLQNFAPPLLERNPFYIELFIRWLTERVFQFEKSTYWPKIGVKFIDTVITLLESSLKTISIRPISMDDLDVLKNQINYISELKEKYKINILLSEFSSQSSSEVSLIMLRRCYTEDLENFLQDFLSPYALRYLFDLDEILRSFIDSEAAISGGEVDGLRLKILLNAFNSPGIKLDCLLQVLKVLDVPWNTVVLELATAAAASTTDFTLSDSEKNIAKEIQKELNFATVKVLLLKYNLPLTCTDYMLLLHNVVNANTVDLKDLVVLKNVLLDNNHYANILYLNRCLQDCEIKLGLDYFNDLSQKEKKIILKSIIYKFEQIINSNSSCTSTEKNYLDFIKGTTFINETQMKDIEDLYKLKNFYDCKFNINDINIERSHVDKDNSGSSTYIMRNRQTPGTILVRSLQCTSTSHRVRTFVANLISTSEDDNYSFLSIFENGNNFSILLEAFDVLTELATNCREEHLHCLIKQLIILNGLIKTNTVLRNLSVTWKFQYMYLSVPSNNSINELLSFLKAIMPSSSLHKDTYEDNDTCDINAFRIISHIALTNASVYCTDINAGSIKLKNKVLRKILNKMITSQNFDEALIISLLLVLRNLENIPGDTWIVDALRGQNDILAPVMNSYLSSLPIRNTFTLDSHINNSTASFPPQYVLKTKFNIILSEISLPEHAEVTWDTKVVLLYVLRQYPGTSSERLKDLCDVLNVSLNDGLSLQLISLLSSWDLNYKVYQDDFGCRQIIIEKDDKIFSKCFTVWESIENKNFVSDVLTDFWRNGEVTLHGRTLSINAYYYEVYLCIYTLLFGSNTEAKIMREYFLLNFLRDYKRSSAPKQYEFEQFSIKGIFPEIGYFRLPFHLFMRDDMWSNLKSEITLHSYEHWLPVISLLSLDSDWQTARDMICSNAVKQTMTSRQRKETTDDISKEYEPWRLIAKEEPLLRSVHRCVRHIANMEWAGACLFYVLQGCTRGADQVAAAHLCYQFAQRWAALQPGNRAVRQMERLRATLSTRHVLYKLEWACEELLRLSTEPAQLIRALYYHPDFIKKIARYDVNRAASEIADKNGINVNSIRMQILENILEKSNHQNKIKDFSTLNNTDLVTAKYILKATCPKMGAIYLSRIASDDDCSLNNCKKLRALQCLMSIIDSDTAIKVTNLERDALWISLLDLLCIVKLEVIDLPWIVMTFLQDKTRAVLQLLQVADGNPAGLNVAILLCLRFGTHKVIHDLINLLLRSHLYKEMIPLLLKLSTNPPDSVICTAWRTVILSPFQNADYPISEHQRINCLNAINLLPICPVIKDEDLKEIWKNCIRCKCLGLGCLILPYMTSQTRQSLTELAKIDKRNLISSLKNLHTESYLVAGAMQVVESMVLRTYR